MWTGQFTSEDGDMTSAVMVMSPAQFSNSQFSEGSREKTKDTGLGT